jgi:CCR4-NOT transcriptional regulation complex NOT5 subunit
MSTTDTSGGGAVGAQNTAVGISSDNTSGDNNTAVGSETVVASTSTTETSVSSDTSGNSNVAVGDTEQNTISVQNTAVGSMDAEIETAVGEVSTSEADQVADQIVAQNIQDQQEQLEEQQQETGEYADEAQLIAYMGYVQGFDDYRQVALADASDWYEPEAIYANVSMSDNNAAFIGLYGDSLTGMRNLMNGQPKL